MSRNRIGKIKKIRDPNARYFLKVPVTVMKSDLSPTAKVLWPIIANKASDKNGRNWKSHNSFRSIERKYHISHSAQVLALEELESKSYIVFKSDRKSLDEISEINYKDKYGEYKAVESIEDIDGGYEMIPEELFEASMSVWQKMRLMSVAVYEAVGARLYWNGSISSFAGFWGVSYHAAFKRLKKLLASKLIEMIRSEAYEKNGYMTYRLMPVICIPRLRADFERMVISRKQVLDPPSLPDVLPPEKKSY